MMLSSLGLPCHNIRLPADMAGKGVESGTARQWDAGGGLVSHSTLRDERRIR